MVFNTVASLHSISVLNPAAFVFVVPSSRLLFISVSTMYSTDHCTVLYYTSALLACSRVSGLTTDGAVCIRIRRNISIRVATYFGRSSSGRFSRLLGVRKSSKFRLMILSHLVIIIVSSYVSSSLGTNRWYLLQLNASFLNNVSTVVTCERSQ